MLLPAKASPMNSANSSTSASQKTERSAGYAMPLRPVSTTDDIPIAGGGERLCVMRVVDEEDALPASSMRAS